MRKVFGQVFVWYFFVWYFAATKLVRQLQLERTQVVYSNKEARKRPAPTLFIWSHRYVDPDFFF